jgi:arginine exporter protein ArgO
MTATTPRPRLVKWLGWALGLGLTRVLPQRITTPALVVGGVAFLGWLVWDTAKTKRETAEHLRRIEERKQAHRQSKDAERAATRLRRSGPAA